MFVCLFGREEYASCGILRDLGLDGAGGNKVVLFTFFYFLVLFFTFWFSVTFWYSFLLFGSLLPFGTLFYLMVLCYFLVVFGTFLGCLFLFFSFGLFGTVSCCFCNFLCLGLVMGLGWYNKASANQHTSMCFLTNIRQLGQYKHSWWLKWMVARVGS